MVEPLPVQPPFGASAAGVRALTISLAAEGSRPVTSTSPKRVSDDQIVLWLVEAGDLVSMRIRRYVLLPVTDDTALIAGSLTQTMVVASARHLVHLYAAALLMDVSLPERSGQLRGESGRGAGAPFMDRFWKLLDQLEADVNTALIPSAVDPAGGGASYRFPPSPLPRGIGF